METVALSEFKINSGQLNQHLNKIASQIPKQDFDQSMTHFFQPTPRHTSGLGLAQQHRSQKRNS